MVKILKKSDVQKLIEETELISIMEEAFIELNNGMAINPHRGQLPIKEENGLLLVMPALLKGVHSIGVKAVTVYPDNPLKHGVSNIIASMILMNSRTGEPICILDATHLTAMRTGAVCALATKYLATPKASSLGVIGTGVQAASIASYICKVRPITKIVAYSNDVYERKEEFKNEVSKGCGIEVHIASFAEDAVRAADIVVTATSSKTPVLKADWLKPIVHINAIGNHDPNSQELDIETVEKSTVICDDIEACLTEAGDCRIPLITGRVSREHFRLRLSDVVAGKELMRSGGVTLFKSIGLAIQDLAAGRFIYDRALRFGIGEDIDLYD